MGVNSDAPSVHVTSIYTSSAFVTYSLRAEIASNQKDDTMKDKMLLRIGTAFMGLGSIAVLGFWVHATQPINDISRAPQSIDLGPLLVSDKETGADQAGTGIMTQVEGTRWSLLMRTVKLRGSITTPDLDWVLQGLTQPPPSLPPDIPQYLAPLTAATRRLELMWVLGEAKSYFPAQKEQIYSATNGYLFSPEPNDKIGALGVMRMLKDVRAVPKVTALLKDPNEQVRKRAQKTLAAISETQ